MLLISRKVCLLVNWWIRIGFLFLGMMREVVRFWMLGGCLFFGVSFELSVREVSFFSGDGNLIVKLGF